MEIFGLTIYSSVKLKFCWYEGFSLNVISEWNVCFLLAGLPNCSLRFTIFGPAVFHHQLIGFRCSHGQVRSSYWALPQRIGQIFESFERQNYDSHTTRYSRRCPAARIPGLFNVDGGPPDDAGPRGGAQHGNARLQYRSWFWIQEELLLLSAS